MNQIKKYQKKEKNNIEVKEESSNELKQLIILIVFIVAILGVVYLVSVLFEKKDYSYIFDNTIDNSEVQYDEVIVGTMLKQSESSYYVLVLDDVDPYYDVLTKYIENYRNLEYKDKIYTVFLNNIFNKKSKVDEADVSNLKFSGTTLVKVENGIIKDSYYDSYEISEIILKMAKELEDVA